MSKSFFALKTFHGGINSKDNPRDMPETQFQDVQGLSVKNVGEIKSAGGYTTYSSGNQNSTALTARGSSPGYGLFSFKADNGLDDAANDTSLLAYPFFDGGISAGENVLIIRETTDSTTYPNDLNLDAGSGIGAPNLVYYYKNGALRVADSNLHANVAPHKFIFNKRVQMLVTEAYSTEWLWVSTMLSAPTAVNTLTNATGDVLYFDVRADADAVDATNPTAAVPGGAGTAGVKATDDINISHKALTSVTTSMSEGTYKFAASWVYDSGQESLLTEATANDITIANTNGILFRAHYKSRAAGAVTYDDFGVHIIGSRIYVKRIENTGDSWHLALDVDFARGTRDSLLDPFRGQGVGDTDQDSLNNVYAANGHAQQFYTDSLGDVAGSYSTFYLMKRLNPMTYESINGYRPSVDLIGMETGHGFKASAVVGTRVFLANIAYKDEFGTNKSMGDRILYSMPNKFDTFPNTNFLDIGADDGESFTALEGFGGMLFAFKNTNMYIINIQSGSPGGWGIAGKYDYMGVKSPSAIAKSELGIIWANEFGCFLSNGQGVQKLTNSISDTTWATFVHDSNPVLVAYEPTEKNVIVQGNSSGSDDLYIFNLPTKSWIRQNNQLDSVNDINTNVVLHDGKPTIASFCETDEGSSTYKVKFFQWNTTSVSQAFVIHTKDFDLGSPNLKKKIYSVVITLNNNNADVTGVYLKVGKDGNAVDTAQWKQGGNGETISANADWTVKKYVLQTPLIVESIAFELTGTGNIKINDFSVEYRPLRKRAD